MSYFIAEIKYFVLNTFCISMHVYSEVPVHQIICCLNTLLVKEIE